MSYANVWGELLDSSLLANGIWKKPSCNFKTLKERMVKKSIKFLFKEKK